MKKERLKRVLYDALLSKIKDKTKKQEIDIFPKDYLNEYGVPIFDVEEMGDLIYEINEALDARFTLINPLPLETENNYSKDDREALGLRGDFYYKVNFDPNNISKKQDQATTPAIFNLSEREGLCLIDTTRCYAVTGERNKILHALRKEYTKTASLVLGTSYENDEDGFRAQIRGINLLFKKKFPEFSARLIFGDQRKGYRFNPDMKVRIQE